MFLKLLLKLLFAGPSRIFVRKCGVSGSSFLILFVIAVVGLFITVSFDSFNYDKASTPMEIFNETETPMIVNTETTNVMMRKQQINQVYERPILANETVSAVHSVAIGDILPDCGLPSPCKKSEFAVHLYTGKDNSDEPRLCVDGKYVISREINGGGRGMNVAVIDSLTKTIVRVGHFDTYEKDSTILETLLLTLRPGDIVILITFDEPSRKLSRIARLLLFDLGSALIQNLNYRGGWFLITQKGISGFSPFEDLHFVDNTGWPVQHDVKLCVPFKIKGKAAHPDPAVNSNPQRVQFCEKHGDLPLFCDADVVNDPLVPSPVWKQAASIDKVYDVPIIVMTGNNSEYLPLTLETLVRQPGVKPNLVVVFHPPANKMVRGLSKLFGFMSEVSSKSPSYCDQVAEAFETIGLLFPDAREVIFLGENAILAPDFLFYLGQLLPILKNDPSVLSVSAFNENGFKGVSSDPSLAFRVESFSSLAVLVRKSFFKKSWCHKESLVGPLISSPDIQGVSLVPDVSRVTLAASMSQDYSNLNISEYYLQRDRTITYEQNIQLKNPERLFREEYDKDLEGLMTTTSPLVFDAESLKKCMQEKLSFQEKIQEQPVLFFSNATVLPGQILSIFFHQHSPKDISTLQYLCHCMGLFHNPVHPVRGLYHGTLRFMLKEHHAILVGSQSPLFRFKPQHIPILQYDTRLKSIINLSTG